MTRDRYRGALLGLAGGDALGTTLEFKPPGTFAPLDDMIGGDPFHLKPGEWTDDTSMALCLVESLIEKHGFDAKDQMDRYCRWHEEGYLSSNARFFDIGNTVRDALETYRSTGLLTDGKHGAPRTDQGPHRIRGGIARRSRSFTAFPLAHARFIRRKIW